VKRYWTNETDLTPAAVAAIVDDDYTRGESWRSATQLIDAPYRVNQMERPEIEFVTADVSDKIYALFGKLIHSMLERGVEKIHGDNERLISNLCQGYEWVKTEDRLYATILGKVVSGQYDLYYRKDGRYVLEDHKVVGINEYKINRQQSKWEQQLNILAYLSRCNEHPVDEVAINCYYRDWSKAKAHFDRTGEYPKTQHMRVPLKCWTQERQRIYVEERVRLHAQSDPAPCSAEDRWASNAAWAVMLPGATKASRVLDSQDEAEAWLHARVMDKKVGGKFKAAKIEYRPGTSLRCMLYCEAAEICPFWGMMKAQ